jgi:hypothetical protein
MGKMVFRNNSVWLTDYNRAGEIANYVKKEASNGNDGNYYCGKRHKIHFCV